LQNNSCFFAKKTGIEQNNQDIFGESAEVEPLPNMHLSLSSLLVVGLGGRLEDPFEKSTCPDIQATLDPDKRKQATAPCVADTVATIPP
jgi:hypothetical protein